MKPRIRGFRSIATRLTAATALLVIALVGVIVWQWAATERRLVRAEKQTEARSFAVAMANAFMNELDDEN